MLRKKENFRKKVNIIKKNFFLLKKRGNVPKTSPTKAQDRSSKLNSHSRPYHSNRQNFFRGDRIKPEPDDDTISLTEEDNMKLDQLIESAMPKVRSSKKNHSKFKNFVNNIKKVVINRKSW